MVFHINKAMWLEASRWPMECVDHIATATEYCLHRNGNGVISIKGRGMPMLIALSVCLCVCV